ncbi:hypothetical protein GCM10010358_79710 [Streptomyces minutiscleroticus]|uniref:YD repeat-containing protein n=1 Tax=Streptomyces minutiscleroticus TaxID=68238 RepID=A0A918UA91_9ACTN|nr:hypothetical protein GCM10010358_79710 [Streptomyces minutiscleroticus]
MQRSTLTYTYDPAGRLISRANVLGQTTTFDRNNLGQIIRKNAGGQVTTYSYDLTDQLGQVTVNRSGFDRDSIV